MGLISQTNHRGGTNVLFMSQNFFPALLVKVMPYHHFIGASVIDAEMDYLGPIHTSCLTRTESIMKFGKFQSVN